MQDATKIYSNPNNGGSEKVIIKAGKHFVASNWGTGFCAPSQVSAADLRRVMIATKAPADAFAAMFGDA